MRIECTDLASFIRNLQEAGSVWRNAIHCDISYRRTGDVRREVVLQATAVLRFDDSEVLLVLGLDCGRDLLTSDGDKSGSDAAEKAWAQLAEFCGERGWKLLPGVMKL